MEQKWHSLCAAFPDMPHEEDFSFRAHTTVGVGGCAPLALYPRGAAELAALLRYVSERGLPYFVLGNGSNLLASDAGFDGAVICTRFVRSVRAEGERIAADCGARLASVLAAAVRQSLCGATFLQGIPATVGGAIFMNAGAQGRCMADIVRSVTAWSEGEIVRVPARECRFAYKRSRFMEWGECVISAELQLKNGNLQSILSDIDRIKRRRSALPSGRSMGCVFQNAGGVSAGALIERAGCKGMSCGGAFVSARHANFLINRGDATARDFVCLIERIRARVRERTGILLREEIRYIGVF